MAVPATFCFAETDLQVVAGGDNAQVTKFNGQGSAVG
jgi:hypothetical protein